MSKVKDSIKDYFQISSSVIASLASELISAGAKVTLVYGPGVEEPPKGAKTREDWEAMDWKQKKEWLDVTLKGLRDELKEKCSTDVLIFYLLYLFLTLFIV